ncbi:hypothetical protein LTR36_005355 [Oleoguttula mirabilis]|uniref:Protein kinase domain-containing protein n=1 Tax=Oleoguttula mirabilis TaxID=1507867 RepID=A0AAV9JGS3_9PEZI|nr:hypothetical protein LTR36_005355 [Oleoguttula mirabilis]
MFSKALSSFTSNISSNYTLSPTPTSTSGPWKIYDAKRKQTNKPVSVFVFSPKSLEPSGGGLAGGRGNASSLKRAHDEVVERLKREASSLARLRHPSILELQEPVEETRSGGLMFATEPVTASLASLLAEKDEQERAGGVGGRGSRYVVEEADGTRKRRELEIDELEIQKGLLQLGKGLEFLHESAGLVHANLTPDAVLVNAKGDWKIAGLAFCGPHASSTAATSLPPISLSEVLTHDPRLPRSVQLNLDYTSPDFVLDTHLTPAADMFSLGLLIVALYNSPHTSPLSTAGSLSTYKRLYSSPSSVPSPGNNFLVPSTHPLPPKLTANLLPRLLTRRPAQRLSAREFQEASYFDNILVATIRFLDALPAKTGAEKAAFLRGLPRIMPQFPKSVLEKKVLPALLDEMKDRELLAPILSNIFAMVKVMPTGKRAFSTVVVPKLTEVFITHRSASAEKDATGKEAGLMVLLEHMQTVAENCSGKEFRDDILPIILLALDSPTHGLVDAALGTLPFVLPVLDFSTIKHELFPVIAAVFAKTSSLAIKIRGLEAFCVLCGGGGASSDADDDDLNGIGVADQKTTGASSGGSVILDKFTVQEKVVPLLKGIKTKEPGVMMAALRVFRQVGEVADSDFLAMDVLPVLWAMSLGPLLNLQQFQAFMGLIQRLSARIEREQTRKLRELSGGGMALGAGAVGVRAASSSSMSANGLTNGEEADFETLVSGKKATAAANGGNDLMNDWGGGGPTTAAAAAAARPGMNTTRTQSAASRMNDTPPPPPTFSWQTANAASAPTPPLQPQQQNALNALRPRQTQIGRSVTPDQQGSLAGFAALTPASLYSQPLQPGRPPASSNVTTSNNSNSNNSLPLRPAQGRQSSMNGPGGGASLDWSAASASAASAWPGQRPAQQLPPPPASATNGLGSVTLARSPFGLPPPPISPQAVGQVGGGSGGFPGLRPPAGQSAPSQQQQPKSGGLDRYESLL